MEILANEESIEWMKIGVVQVTDIGYYEIDRNADFLKTPTVTVKTVNVNKVKISYDREIIVVECFINKNGEYYVNYSIPSKEIKFIEWKRRYDDLRSKP